VVQKHGLQRALGREKRGHIRGVEGKHPNLPAERGGVKEKGGPKPLT